MEDRNITYIGGGIIILLLFLAIFGFVSNSKNKKNLAAERALTENLRNENQQIRQELDSLSTEHSALSTKNDSTLKRLEESEARATQGSRRIAALSRENKDLNQSRAELEQLKLSNAELQNNYNDLQTRQEKVLAQNRDLQNSLAAMETQRNDVTGRYEKTMLYNSDNFLVTATRGKKDKLVSRAGCAKKLNLSFEVPQNLKDTVTYQIESPSGNKITSYVVPEDYRYYTASLPAFHDIANPRQVNLVYQPEGKLEKGEYRIQLLSNGTSIGNCRIMLR